MSRVSVAVIAMACHEANKALCEAFGDNSQKPWDKAEVWQRDSAIEGVEWAIANPDAGPGAQHEAWMKAKERDGWVYGEVKDAEKKTHPSMLPFSQLSASERAKDGIFRAIVAALK